MDWRSLHSPRACPDGRRGGKSGLLLGAGGPPNMRGSVRLDLPRSRSDSPSGTFPSDVLGMASIASWLGAMTVSVELAGFIVVLVGAVVMVNLFITRALIHQELEKFGGQVRTKEACELIHKRVDVQLGKRRQMESD